MNNWDITYQKTPLPWGQKPDYPLIRYASLVPKGRVLDLGIGDGRNAFYYAHLGYEIEGVDVSQTAIERCLKRAQKDNFKFNIEAKDIRDVTITPQKYSLIIAAWTLNFFKKCDLDIIIKKIKNGIKKDGFIYIGGFSPIDPGFARSQAKFKMVEEKTFFDTERNLYIHFFTKEEMLSYFTDFKAIYCVEGLELDVDHGKPHYHGIVVYMGQQLK